MYLSGRCAATIFGTKVEAMFWLKRGSAQIPSACDWWVEPTEPGDPTGFFVTAYNASGDLGYL